MADVIVARALVAAADVLISIEERVEPLPLVADPDLDGDQDEEDR